VRERRSTDTVVELVDFFGDFPTEEREPDGYHVERHDDGSRKAAGGIVDGSRDGAWSEWHENGSIEASGTYFAGERHGPWSFWDSDGAELRRGEFLYGRREGSWVRFENGMRTESEYRNGLEHGRVQRTDPAGRVSAEEKWFRGKRHGLSSGYHANGQLASHGSYEHGKKTGVWKYWHADGSIDMERSRLVEPEDRRAGVEAELAASRRRGAGRPR
jgi:antitoxin component YwqK of YwqJK toxin-antitoxin module